MSEANNKVLPKAGSYIMLAKQIYHTASPYIILRNQYIIEKLNDLCYSKIKKAVSKYDIWCESYSYTYCR